MSASNMPTFFDNILDDASPIGELPDLEQVPEFVDEEPNLSPSENNAQFPGGAERRNSGGDLTDQYDKPILLNPSDESVFDKLASEALSESFPTFCFDTTSKERDEQEIDFESALKEVDDIGTECENFQSAGEKRSGDAVNEVGIHAYESTNESTDPRTCADTCCKENVPPVNGAVKQRKTSGRKLKRAAKRPSKKARAESVRHVVKPLVSDVTASSATSRVPAPSQSNSRNSPSLQRSSGLELVGHFHPNNAAALNTPRQPLPANVPNNGGPYLPTTCNKPPGLTLAPHMQHPQERSAVSPQDLLSPASPLGLLPGDVRDQLLIQARRQSYATAEMRAIMMAQEAASNMYRKTSNGETKPDSANPSMPIPSAGMRVLQPVAMQPVAQLAGAGPSSTLHIPPNALNQARQPSLRAVQPQRQVISNGVPVSSNMHATQMHSVSNTLTTQAVPFSRVSSADSHAKQIVLQQNPNAIGQSAHINNSNHNLQVNANPSSLINNNGSKPPFHQTAPYPIFDTKLTGMNGVPTVGPSGMQRISKEARNSEAVAQTLANTYDQVNKLSATTMASGRASRRSRLPNREPASSSQDVLNPQHKRQQQKQANVVASSAALSIPTPTPTDPSSARLTAAAVRRQLSQNRNGPRLRFSKNAGPSKYCHICGRSASTVGVAVCGNLPLGLCRKVLCDKCLLIHEPEKLEMAKTKNSGWTCTHCRNVCPPKARCHQYTRNNQKRREKNDQKKRMKRELQEQQVQQDQENKRRRASSSEQPEEQGQRISPTGVSDGTFG